jgi:UvrD/REP helicase N-terminal domain
MANHDAPRLKEALARTTRAQQLASDPSTSAWVSANAGTGKTYVLTTRVLRLLLAGTKPERILALTYTKARDNADRSSWTPADCHRIRPRTTIVRIRD